MRSRQYTKRVEFYDTTVAPDGYGGNTVTGALAVTCWANVQTPKNTQRLTDMGVTDLANTIIVGVRHREDHTFDTEQYLVYRNEQYVIHSIINKGFEDVDIEIIAVKDKK